VRGERYTGNRFEIPSRRSGGDEDYYRRKLAPYNPGSVVKILYDPKNPRLSVVTQPHINYFFIAMIGSLSLLFCAIAVWRLYAFVCNLLKPQSRSPGT
jgi:hypothetical protein